MLVPTPSGKIVFYESIKNLGAVIALIIPASLAFYLTRDKSPDINTKTSPAAPAGSK